MPYPPGLSRRDKVRAGIIHEEVHCVECDAEVTSEDHAEWCELKDMDTEELAELEAEEAQHIEYSPVEHE